MKKAGQPGQPKTSTPKATAPPKKDRRGTRAPEAAKKERRVNQRREFPRVPVNIEVDYRSDDNFLFAYITDLSAMGIFVKTKKPKPPGARLTLRFKPLGTPELVVQGQVVWINPYRPGDPDNLNPGMGVQFVDLDPETQRRLTRIVKTFAYLDDEDSTLGNS